MTIHRPRRSPLAALPILLLGGCGPAETEPASFQPEGWDTAIRIPQAADLNPDPDIVEVELDARVEPIEIMPGTVTETWTYNGQLPGPLISAKVGDRVLVRLTNHLPEPTTIHWHGLRIPAAMDGMPGHSQEAVPPGGSFVYEFIVPDASTFWYHSHQNSAPQVGNGLYAPFVVRDPGEPPGIGDEVVLVLSDISLQDDGTLDPPDIGGELGTLFGREGSILLVNGKRLPTLRARPGAPQRWRVINAARSRYYQLALADHSFLRIGGDGGLLEQPVTVERPVLAPGERADLVVVPKGAPGADLTLRWIPYDRGYGTTFNRPEEDLLLVRLEGAPVATPEVPVLRRTIEPLAVEGATPVKLRLTQQGMSPIELGINDQPLAAADPLYAAVGETQVWTVTNTIPWSHPFHLHGFFFQVLDVAGPREWKDTVDVPVDKTVRFAVRYDDRPGMWMFHCHILDHADAGMAGMLMVEGAP